MAEGLYIECHGEVCIVLPHSVCALIALAKPRPAAIHLSLLSVLLILQ